MAFTRNPAPPISLPRWPLSSPPVLGACRYLCNVNAVRQCTGSRRKRAGLFGDDSENATLSRCLPDIDGEHGMEASKKYFIVQMDTALQRVSRLLIN